MTSFEDALDDFFLELPEIQNPSELLDSLTSTSICSARELAFLTKKRNKGVLVGGDLAIYLHSSIKEADQIGILKQCMDTTGNTEVSNLLATIFVNSNFSTMDLSEPAQFDAEKHIQDCNSTELSKRMRVTDEKIGKGGYSCVFKAVDKGSNAALAVKLIDIEGTEKKHVEREKDILNIFKNSECSHIVKYLGCWIITDSKKLPEEFVNLYKPKETLCLLMELCDSSLDKWLQVKSNRTTPDGAKFAKTFFANVVDGLNELHSKGVIHRDIKPANILLDKGIAKITDFGFSRIYKPESISFYLSNGLGTAWYCSPQQEKDDEEYTLKTDVYAMGRILLELYQPPDESIAQEKDLKVYRNRLKKSWPTFLQKHPKVALMALYMSADEEDSRPTIRQVIKLTKWYVLKSEDDDRIKIKKFHRSQQSLLQFNPLKFLEYQSITHIELNNIRMRPIEFVAAVNGHTSLSVITLDNMSLEDDFPESYTIHLPKLLKFRLTIRNETSNVKEIKLVRFIFFYKERGRALNETNVMKFLDEFEFGFSGFKLFHGSNSTNMLVLGHVEFQLPKIIQSMSNPGRSQHLHYLQVFSKAVELSPILPNLAGLKVLTLISAQVNNIDLRRLECLKVLDIDMLPYSKINFKHLPKSLSFLGLRNAGLYYSVDVVSQQSDKVLKLKSMRLSHCIFSELRCEMQTFVDAEEIFVESVNLGPHDINILRSSLKCPSLKNLKMDIVPPTLMTSILDGIPNSSHISQSPSSENPFATIFRMGENSWQYKLENELEILVPKVDPLSENGITTGLMIISTSPVPMNLGQLNSRGIAHGNISLNFGVGIQRD